MIFYKAVSIISSPSLILGILGINLLAQPQLQARTVNLDTRHDLRTDFSLSQKISQTFKPIISFEKLAGSDGTGQTINNQDRSLACSLQKWQLIGIFRDNRIQKTKGELQFKLTNNGSTSQRFILAELLFLNDLDMPLNVSNPHRRLQGNLIDLKPPLKPGETRKYTTTIWYKSNWHKVQLKTCRWLEHGSDYWQIYPELKPESKK